VTFCCDLRSAKTILAKLSQSFCQITVSYDQCSFYEQCFTAWSYHRCLALLQTLCSSKTFAWNTLVSSLKPTTMSCADDLLHAITGSPDPMDTLSYNILQCFITFSKLSLLPSNRSYWVQLQSNHYVYPPHRGRDVAEQQYFQYLTTSQRQVFAALLSRSPMLFSSTLGNYPHWLLPFSFVYTTKDAVSTVFPTLETLCILHARFTI
jgi:hypothetical protein